MEDFAGAPCFQILQTAPDALSVRLYEPDCVKGKNLWGRVANALRGYLRTQGLATVTLSRDLALPQRSVRS